MSDSILQVKNLKMYYHTSRGAVRALGDVSFDLGRGETLGLVGESGCGKTSLGTSILRMPSAPGRYEGGQILVENRDILPLTEREIRRDIRWEKIAMVFQGAMNCLTPVYTIGRQMMETMQVHRGMDKREAEGLIGEYLELVGLPKDTAKRYPHELSGGMKQRVVIALALFLKPEIVILDEPTTALDVIVQSQIINLLKKLKMSFDLSFLFITHDLALEAEVADRVCVMYAGTLVELASNERIYGAEGPAHPYTQMLLAATPRLHRRVESLAFIPGTTPDLVAPTSGCRFHPRCPYVFARCLSQEPPLRPIESGHLAACWRCAE
jgi:peptide/nickel transport system ATP-binding protein